MATYQSQFYRPSMMTPVRIAVTGQLTGIFKNGQNGVGSTFLVPTTVFDGVSPRVGDRVLLYGQTDDPHQNGIYVVVTHDETGTLFQRSYDFQSSDQMAPGNFCTVKAGTANKGKIAVVVEPQCFKVDSDPISIVFA